MKLNESTGNMYQWITHTGNTIKGECPHDCSYCYMKRWGKQNSIRFDPSELRVPMSDGKFIFVGSSCDMFAEDIPSEWIIKTLNHCSEFDNTYLFQSKNPEGFISFGGLMPDKIALCTTIETNRVYPDIMRNSPDPVERALVFGNIPIEKKYVTIEPIMDFDMGSMIKLIEFCRPKQVNIGADSNGHNIPEPNARKIEQLILELNEITIVKVKKNLKRLYESSSH